METSSSRQDSSLSEGEGRGGEGRGGDREERGEEGKEGEGPGGEREERGGRGEGWGRREREERGGKGRRVKEDRQGETGSSYSCTVLLQSSRNHDQPSNPPPQEEVGHEGHIVLPLIGRHVRQLLQCSGISCTGCQQ